MPRMCWCQGTVCWSTPLSAAPCCSEIRAMVPSHWVLAAQPRTQSAGQKAGFVNESYVLCYLTEPSEALMMPTKAHFFSQKPGLRNTQNGSIHREIKRRCRLPKSGWLLESVPEERSPLLINSHVCSVVEPKTGWKSPSLLHS